MQDSAIWSEGVGLGVNPSISYSRGEKQAIVELVCATSGTNVFEALGESPLNTYTFRLTHKCACWNRCRGK